MSEIKTLEVEVTHPDILDVDVDFGQTLTKIVAPEHYMGPFEFYPSDEDQIIPVKEKMPVEDICVKGAEGSLEITANGTYDVVGKKEVVVNNPEEWTTEGFLDLSQPSGDFTLNHVTVPPFLFGGRYNVTGISAPNATRVNTCAFRGCTHLKSLYFPVIDQCEDNAFADCTELERICFPTFRSLGKFAFLNNASLKEVHLPRAYSVPQGAFQQCSSLEFLYLPSQRTTGTSTFNRCTNLKTLILPALYDYGGNAAFSQCPNLKTVVFGYSIKPVINENVSNWQQTPFAEGGTGGEIYIPKVLYDHLGDGTALDYEAAKNWSTMIPWGTITWKQIEGSEYETYMPGGAKYEEEMALT